MFGVREGLLWTFLVAAVLCPPGDDVAVQTAPQSPFKKPILKRCEQITGAMQTAKKAICEQKDNLNLFSILLSKVVKGDSIFSSNRQAACKVLKPNENQTPYAALLRIKTLYRGMKNIADASGKRYQNIFSEDKHSIWDRSNWEIFQEGLEQMSDVESTSTLQLLFALLETSLENRVQIRLGRVDTKEFQASFLIISIFGVSITLLLVFTYVMIGLYYAHRHCLKCKQNRDQQKEQKELERMSRLMQIHRDQQERAMNEALLPLE